MSVENKKVCCNCQHNIRIKETPMDGGKSSRISCFCSVHKEFIGYAQCMEGWCRHWAKEKGGKE